MATHTRTFRTMKYNELRGIKTSPYSCTLEYALAIQTSYFSVLMSVIFCQHEDQLEVHSSFNLFCKSQPQFSAILEKMTDHQVGLAQPYVNCRLHFGNDMPNS